MIKEHKYLRIFFIISPDIIYQGSSFFMVYSVYFLFSLIILI